MASASTPLGTPITTPTVIQRINLSALSHMHQIGKMFPAHSLESDATVALGIAYLQQYGDAHFDFFQRTYRLTKEEAADIFRSAEDYPKNSITWKELDERAFSEPIALIRAAYPHAKFSLLCTTEENAREHPIVEIEGKRYTFYSGTFKGGQIDSDYITHFKEHGEQEQRPSFLVVPSETMPVFLMEFKGTQTPNFRHLEHLEQLMGLIVAFSLNKKGLDMLPCRLALEGNRLYCVDPKLAYITFATPFDAYRENISNLKAKICYRGYAEETILLAHVDRLAGQMSLPIFEKTLEGCQFGYRIHAVINPSLLTNEDKINLGAACLMRLGLKEFPYYARDFALSIADQLIAKMRAGHRLIDNVVSWDDNIPPNDNLHQTAVKALGGVGHYAIYCNRVGNYKSVLTVQLEGECYVVRKVTSDYVERYKSCMELEHRPPFRTFPCEDGQLIFLTKFMGSQTLDYTNTYHLDLIVGLVLIFPTLIDFNAGNLVIHEEKLYYIDKDLGSSTHSVDPKIRNFDGMMEAIGEACYLEHERMALRRYAAHKFSQTKLSLARI